MKTAQFTESIAYHGEGPCWFERPGHLRFVDMLAGDVLTVTEDGVQRAATGSSVVSVVRPRQGPGAVVALESGIGLAASDDLTDVTPFATLFEDPAVRTNEGACDPLGRFWIGTMRYDQAQGGAVMYRVDPDGTVSTHLTDLTISNGLIWTPDGTRAFYADTPTCRIDVFDFVDGELRNRRPFVQVSGEEGKPDGLTLDAEGGVWAAMNGGGRVHRFDADGSLSEVVEVPVSQPTAVTFGGEGLGRLFVTTSRENLAGDEEPRAGAVFVADPGVSGVLPLPFGA